MIQRMISQTVVLFMPLFLFLSPSTSLALNEKGITLKKQQLITDIPSSINLTTNSPGELDVLPVYSTDPKSHLDSETLKPGPTQRPARLLRTSVVASAPSSSADAWISTIKGIAVCWAIVAFIWIFFRIMAGASFCCQLWMYRRTSLNLASQLVITNNRAHPDIRVTTTEQGHALLTDLHAQENKVVNMTGHQNDSPPPEYAKFLPPSYDQVMELENLTTSTSFADGENYLQVVNESLRPTM